MKRLQVIRVDSLNGDTHFVILESQFSEKRENAEDYNEAEVKKASKRDASKPLILARAE
jgi:hypothetical protein